TALALPCALRTNGTTTPATGSDPMETKIGSSTSLASCIAAMPASTIFRLKSRSASITGRLAVALTTIRGFRILACSETRIGEKQKGNRAWQVEWCWSQEAQAGWDAL